ncbi:MAG TPA: hypothetical protein VFJ06_14145 [Halococcus sp.]|nr:hypothetical protein [Halococcus sp.]
MSIHADAAEQTITGWSVGVGDTALCTYCKSDLGEGDDVTAYAYRRAGEQVVNVARLYCDDCDRDRIEHPSCGCYEWLAEARLALTSDVARQSHGLTLIDVSVIAESGPEDSGTL